jgi:chromosome segregation ATPase
MAVKEYLNKDGLLYYNEKLKGILHTKADVATVNSQLADLDGKINTTKSDLENFVNTVSVQKVDVAAFDANNQAVSADIERTNQSVAQLRTDTGNEVAELKHKDEGHSEAIEKLVKKDTELDTDITNLQSKDLQHDNLINELSNLKANKADVTKEIEDAIKGVTQFNYELVEELPEVGVKGTVYLVKYSEGAQGDVYQEFIYVENTQTFECLGFTNEIDLSNYVTFDDIKAITNTEIDELFV